MITRAPELETRPDLDLRSDDHVSLFVDGAAIFHQSRMRGFDVDYKKLRNMVTYPSRLYRALFFLAIKVKGEEEDDYNPVVRLGDFCEQNGWMVRRKQFVDKEAERGPKGSSVSVDMAVQMMLAARYSKTMFLVSTHGDMVHVVDAVQSLGCRVSLIGDKEFCSGELRRAADNFVDLHSLEPYIGRPRPTTEDPVTHSPNTLRAPRPRGYRAS